MKIVFKFIVLILPLSLIFTFYFLLTNNESYPGADYDVFDIPKFELGSLNNHKTLNESSLDKDFILNVWASWCITCRVEHPYLMSLSKKGIPVVGLNYKDEKEDGLEWIERYGNPYKTILYDYKGTLAMDLGVTGAPETFLIIDGKIVVRYQGEVNELIWNDVFLPVIKNKDIF